MDASGSIDDEAETRGITLENLFCLYLFLLFFFCNDIARMSFFFNLFTWSLNVYVFGFFLLFLHFGFRQFLCSCKDAGDTYIITLMQDD